MGRWGGVQVFQPTRQPAPPTYGLRKLFGLIRIESKASIGLIRVRWTFLGSTIWTPVKSKKALKMGHFGTPIHAFTGASHDCDTVTTSAERTTPSQARPAPVGGVHPGATGARRVVPPLETGVAHYSWDPYHWAATHVKPGKETRRSAYAS